MKRFWDTMSPLTNNSIGKCTNVLIVVMTIKKSMKEEDKETGYNS